MRLDGRARGFMAGREQGGVRRVVHRVIGAAACSLGLRLPQEQTRSLFGSRFANDDLGSVKRQIFLKPCRPGVTRFFRKFYAKDLRRAQAEGYGRRPEGNAVAYQGRKD